MAAALLALVSILGFVASAAYVYSFVAEQAAPAERDFMIIGLGFIASVIVALIGLVLGGLAWWMARQTRAVAVFATVASGAIVLITVSLLAFGFSQISITS